MERDCKKESDCSEARARYLPLQIWYLTSPRLSAPASTSPPSLSSLLGFPQKVMFTSADLPPFPPSLGLTHGSFLCSLEIFTLYMSRIHVVLVHFL